MKLRCDIKVLIVLIVLCPLEKKIAALDGIKTLYQFPLQS